eukprot:scaffold160171_cov30-Tisochrysis_lutea.AAC.2
MGGNNRSRSLAKGPRRLRRWGESDLPAAALTGPSCHLQESEVGPSGRGRSEMYALRRLPRPVPEASPDRQVPARAPSSARRRAEGSGVA